MQNSANQIILLFEKGLCVTQDENQALYQILKVPVGEKGVRRVVFWKGQSLVMTKIILKINCTIQQNAQ